MLETLKIFWNFFRKIKAFKENCKKIKEKFCEILRMFLKFNIIFDTIAEIWGIFINFQKFLWLGQRFWINTIKELEFLNKYKKLKFFLKLMKNMFQKILITVKKFNKIWKKNCKKFRFSLKSIKSFEIVYKLSDLDNKHKFPSRCKFIVVRL